MKGLMGLAGLVSELGTQFGGTHQPSRPRRLKTDPSNPPNPQTRKRTISARDEQGCGSELR